MGGWVRVLSLLGCLAAWLRRGRALRHAYEEGLLAESGEARTPPLHEEEARERKFEEIVNSFSFCGRSLFVKVERLELIVLSFG